LPVSVGVVDRPGEARPSEQSARSPTREVKPALASALKPARVVSQRHDRRAGKVIRESARRGNRRRPPPRWPTLADVRLFRRRSKNPQTITPNTSGQFPQVQDDTSQFTSSVWSVSNAPRNRPVQEVRTGRRQATMAPDARRGLLMIGCIAFRVRHLHIPPLFAHKTSRRSRIRDCLKTAARRWTRRSSTRPRRDHRPTDQRHELHDNGPTTVINSDVTKLRTTDKRGGDLLNPSNILAAVACRI